jgi:hypothetical protein
MRETDKTIEETNDLFDNMFEKQLGEINNRASSMSGGQMDLNFDHLLKKE